MPTALLRRAMEAFGVDFYQVYGMTEASGAFCILGPDDHRDPAHPERLASAGRPVEGVEMRVTDPATGRPLGHRIGGNTLIETASLDWAVESGRDAGGWGGMSEGERRARGQRPGWVGAWAGVFEWTGGARARAGDTRLLAARRRRTRGQGLGRHLR